MIQSMEILQLPILALQERIEQELAENPLLEITEQEPEREPDETPVEPPPADERSEGEREMVVDEKKGADDFERLVDLDRDVPDYFDESPRRSVNRMDEESDRKHDAIANIESRPETLNDYLLHQLGEQELDDEMRMIAERIISTLDARDGGYLRCSLRDLLPADATPDQLEVAEWALEVVQQLDPIGVAARDLRECLLLQLKPGTPYHDELRTIISGHLEDLRDNRLPQIQRVTGYSLETIKAAWNELRKLNPKPGASFADAHVPVVTPDIVVEKAADGRYQVILEDDRTPSLFISEHYRRRLASGEATHEEKEYIKRKINAAQWLIESIEQRRSTLTKVSIWPRPSASLKRISLSLRNSRKSWPRSAMDEGKVMPTRDTSVCESSSRLMASSWLTSSRLPVRASV